MQCAHGKKTGTRGRQADADQYDPRPLAERPFGAPYATATSASWPRRTLASADGTRMPSHHVSGRACFSRLSSRRPVRGDLRHPDGRPGPVDFPEYLHSLRLPHEPRGVFVALSNVEVVRLFQVRHGRETSIPYAVPRDFTEETLHEVQPRTRRRRVVHVDAGMLFKPFPHGFVLVRRIVVGDNLDRDVLWRGTPYLL